MVTATGERKELLQERTLLANGWWAGRERQIYVKCSNLPGLLQQSRNPKKMDRQAVQLVVVRAGVGVQGLRVHMQK